jgi:hypothetical protein
MAASWSEVLDLYGRALLDFDHEIEAGQASMAVFDFKLPDDPGPLPPELAEVAANIFDLSARVERRTRALMDEISREQATVTRARAQAQRTRPLAKFIDVNG